jgi:hypothetical protein
VFLVGITIFLVVFVGAGLWAALSGNVAANVFFSAFTFIFCSIAVAHAFATGSWDVTANRPQSGAAFWGYSCLAAIGWLGALLLLISAVRDLFR